LDALLKLSSFNRQNAVGAQSKVVEQTFVSRSLFITSSQTSFLFAACALPFDALLTMLTAFVVAECKRVPV